MRWIVLAALAAACLPGIAQAAPRHHIADVSNMVGCSQPEMRPCVGIHHHRSALKTQHNRRKSDRLHTAGRHIPHLGGKRPRAWCGWWMMRRLGKTDRRLWLARAWATEGTPASGPGIDVVVVWPHHVGLIVGREGGEWVVISGNDGGRVRERPRSLRGAIAFRRV